MTLKMIATDWLALKSRYWMTIIPLVLMIIAIIASGFIGIWLTLFAAYAACGGAMDPFIVEQKRQAPALLSVAPAFAEKHC